MSDELTRLCNKARKAYRIMLIIDIVMWLVVFFLSVYLFWIGKLVIPIILVSLVSARLFSTWLNDPDLL